MPLGPFWVPLGPLQVHLGSSWDPLATLGSPVTFDSVMEGYQNPLYWPSFVVCGALNLQHVPPPPHLYSILIYTLAPHTTHGKTTITQLVPHPHPGT